jgi:hypothetical protein
MTRVRQGLSRNLATIEATIAPIEPTIAPIEAAIAPIEAAVAVIAVRAPNRCAPMGRVHYEQR